jgi:hypothetical protein
MAYRGFTVKLPVGAQGFTGTRNPSQAGPGHLTFVDGVELYGGILRKEGGAEKFNASAISGDPTIISGINWSPAAGVTHDVIVTSDGDVLKDTGAGTFGTTLDSGLIADRDPPPLFVTAGGEAVAEPRKLFLFSASNQVGIVAGTADTMAAISDPPVDWDGGAFPTFGVLHASRMWGGGNASDPHRIYFTSVGDHEDYLDGGTLSIYPGEGEGLVGGISFRGALVLWKYPSGIYVVNTTDPSPANWTVSRITRAVGSLNQHVIVQIDNDVLYMDYAGNIHALSATQEFGDMSTSNISRGSDIEPFMQDNVNRLLLKRAVGTWYASKRQAWFCITTLGNVDNDLRVVLGFEQQQSGLRFFMSRRDKSPSIWLRPSSEDLVPRPSIGDNEGFVWNLDTEARNKDGDAYQMRFETANSDLQFADPGLATRMKSGQFLEIATEPRGDWDLTVELYWDDILTDVLQFNMGGAGSPLGSFTLDTDVLGSEAIASQRQRVTGSGRRVRLIGYNNGEGQDVSVAEFFLSFGVMDERIREAS